MKTAIIVLLLLIAAFLLLGIICAFILSGRISEQERQDEHKRLTERSK